MTMGLTHTFAHTYPVPKPIRHVLKQAQKFFEIKCFSNIQMQERYLPFTSRELDQVSYLGVQLVIGSILKYSSTQLCFHETDLIQII